MRASEFIVETRKIGKISKRQQQATRGLAKFRDPGGYDRTYELNRIMMAAACTDGHLTPVLNAESWSGRYNTAHPYTDIEHEMMKKAFKAVGSDAQDLNKGDLSSQEMDSVNRTSPVTGFKGYPR
jgi:hypothetical protein